jgi:ferric-dicitrate binding protein FerR (iron transport regulator)
MLPIRRTVTTGPDGYARLEMRGGASVELYANSRIIFRQNFGDEGDLLDVLSGRVRVHFSPVPGESQQRIRCRIASITARVPATVALATDEDNSVRIDVLEGEVAVQHALLPRNEPTIVKAIDAIVIQKDQQISRRVDRGTLYRYTVKPLHDLFEAVTLGHSRPQVQEQPLVPEPIFATIGPLPLVP